MELKDRKLLNNLPKFASGLDALESRADNIISNSIQKGIQNSKSSGYQSDSAAAGAGPWFALGAWLGGGVAEGLNSIKKENELLSDAGTSNASVAGVSYTMQNPLKYDMGDYDKETATSFLTNPARGITRLFARSGQEEALKKAKQQIQTNNLFAYDNAFTRGQQMKYAQRNGNSEDQVLYAKNGKDVDTAFGVGSGKQNAWVSKGEFIFDTGSGIGHTVKRGPNDTAPAFLRGRDAVVTNKYGLADAAKTAYANGDIAGVYDVLNTQKQLHMMGYKNGKDIMPNFANGRIPAWTNYVPNAIGSLASIGQYIDAASQDIHTPDIYAENPYSAQALRDMAGLQYDAYPVAQQLIRERAKTDNALEKSGGLSGSQKYLGKIANAHNYYNTMANVWADFQKGNISLRQALNQAKINVGAQDAQRRQSANQYNTAYAAQAHAARQQGKQMGLRNVLDYMNNYAAMEFKRRQANYMMGLYDEGYNTDKQNAASIYMPMIPFMRSSVQSLYEEPQLKIKKYIPTNFTF